MVTLVPARQISAEIREKSPLVGCITNSVVTNYTANLLLAVGAAPAMVDIVGEAGLFAGVANATLINLGTPTPEQRQAALEAAPSAHEAGRTWVLDPVAVGLLPVRTALAKELLAHWPTVIRGNASEIIALAGEGAGGRGVDSADSVDAAILAAQALSDAYGSIVAISGEVDAIVQGDTLVRVAGGSALLTKVTGGRLRPRRTYWRCSLHGRRPPLWRGCRPRHVRCGLGKRCCSLHRSGHFWRVLP